MAKAEQWGDTIAITPGTESSAQLKRLGELIAAQREREAAYILDPSLWPEPDPYVWVDPFEDRW
jgi:hypothetical protein